MRSTAERTELSKKRADEMKNKRRKKRFIIVSTLCYSVCIVLIAAISYIVCNLDFVGFDKISLSNTASIFTNKAFIGYAIVGILAFLLGISVTVMCDILHKRKKERDKENDRADR